MIICVGDAVCAAVKTKTVETKITKRDTEIVHRDISPISEY